MIRVLLLPLAMTVFSLVVVRADNWPQWRGPQLNGVSSETNLPVNWTADDNIAWKLPLPEWSGATPIVWGDYIFLNVAQGRFAVALVRGPATGPAVLWKRRSAAATTRSASRTCRRRRRSPTARTSG